MEENNNNICSVCYTDIINIVTLKCKHNFCLDCILKMNKFRKDEEEIKCPLCRKIININDTYKNIDINKIGIEYKREEKNIGLL